jgi:poly(A) polymerase
MTHTLKEILSSAKPVESLKALKAQGVLSDLEPTLAALEMPIPSGYNHKDNLEHSFQVLQNAIDREEDGVDLILRTAALFHDIGKPATRKFGKKGTVTFTNHDVVGAKMVRQILPNHGYSKSETDSVARLVYMHMRSHSFKAGWSESAVRRLSTDAGSHKQLERLIVIFYADATTKHNGKKNQIHSSVAELTSELLRVKKSDERKALRPALDGIEVAEFLNIPFGPKLGSVMKFLNSDTNIQLNKEEAYLLLKSVYLNK